MRKKKIEEDIYYDGYYNDIAVVDENSKEEAPHDKAVLVNVALIGFITVLVVATVAVLLFAF